MKRSGALALPFPGGLCDPHAPMPKPNPKQLLRVAGNYLKSHPEEIWRAVKGAAGLRFGLPMDALRYLIRELADRKSTRLNSSHRL